MVGLQGWLEELFSHDQKPAWKAAYMVQIKPHQLGHVEAAWKENTTVVSIICARVYLQLFYITL